MSDLAGPVIVTGANSGVGRSLTRLLLEAGAEVVMVCRSRERGEAALHDLTADSPPGRGSLEIADLSDFAAVRALADRLRDIEPPEALVNNAGVWRSRLERTSDGLELTMATNHLGHFLLTRLLLDRLADGGRRIVNVSSEAHRRGDLRRAPLEDIATGRAWKGGVQAYSDTKLANALFTAELVRRYGDGGLIANSLHPGVLATRIWNKTRNPITLLLRMAKPFMKSPDVGGRAIFRLLADPELAGVTDAYFDVERVRDPQPAARDVDLARDLWETSERFTGLDA